MPHTLPNSSTEENEHDVRFILEQAHFAQEMLEASAALFVALSDARNDVDRGKAVETYFERISSMMHPH